MPFTTVSWAITVVSPNRVDQQGSKWMGPGKQRRERLGRIP